HDVAGEAKRVLVHRKGATRAFPAGRDEVPSAYRPFGQPVLIPGDMGTASYVLAGLPTSMARSFGSSCHGAGRRLSRHAANRTFRYDDVTRALRSKGIQVRAATHEGVTEEAPGAYKDVEEVVRVAEGAGLTRRVARLIPLGVVKG
ncbi:MAG: RtcB family protein, partial [Thermoplasmata archaeon]